MWDVHSSLTLPALGSFSAVHFYHNKALTTQCAQLTEAVVFAANSSTRLHQSFCTALTKKVELSSQDLKAAGPLYLIDSTVFPNVWHFVSKSG